MGVMPGATPYHRSGSQLQSGRDLEELERHVARMAWLAKQDREYFAEKAKEPLVPAIHHYDDGKPKGLLSIFGRLFAARSS